MENNEIKHLSHDIDNDILDEIKEIYHIDTSELKDRYNRLYNDKLYKLNKFNSYVLNLLNPSNSISDDNSPQKAFKVFSNLTSACEETFNGIKIDFYENISRILDNELFINAISETDAKFKAYTDIRKNLDLLKTKILIDKNFDKKNIVFNSIDAVLKDVDNYIITYLMFYFVMKEQSIEIYKRQNKECKNKIEDSSIVLYEAVDDDENRY